MDSVFFSEAEIFRFAIVLFRVAGIMVFAPLFGSSSIPYQAKAVLTLVATVALVPALPAASLPGQLTLTSLAGLAAGEAVFGLVLGLGASFVFAGMQLAGQIISFQLGFSIVNLIDPQSEVETSIFSFLQNFVGLLLFLLINGHHWFFQAVSESFNYLPVAGIHLKGPVALEFIRLSSQVLVFGVQIAAPVIAITVVADVVMGIVGRVAPQINMLIVGMPLKVLAGFGALSISFYFLPQLLGESYLKLSRELFALLHRLT
jgi:flagellar biosynthetic protein FliR